MAQPEQIAPLSCIPDLSVMSSSSGLLACVLSFTPGFSPVIDRCHLISNRFNGLERVEKYKALRKTVETVPAVGASFDAGLKPRCE